jgi:protein TonB
MKKILIITIAFFFFQIVSAQETTNVSDNTVYNTAGIDVKPDFPGGIGEFYKYFAKNYRTPNVKKLNGKVFVSFVIEKDGSIGEVMVLRDIGYGTGEEAIRVLNNSPKWLPAEQDGRKVRCTFSLPINIDTR